MHRGRPPVRDGVVDVVTYVQSGSSSPPRPSVPGGGGGEFSCRIETVAEWWQQWNVAKSDQLAKTIEVDRYEIADTEKMSIFHGVSHSRIGKRTKKH